MRVPVCLFLFAFSVLAQNEHGTITGTVSDPGGKVVANAPVQAKNEATGTVHKGASSATGNYTIEQVPAGKYELSVGVAGLKGYQRKGVVVQAAQTLRINIGLEESTQLSTIGEDPATIAADLRRQPPPGPTPRTADGKPDLSGVWRRPRVLDPGRPETLPWAEAIMKQRMEHNGKDSPFARCLPASPIRFPAYFKFVQAPSALIMILDDDVPGFREVFMDGRSHPKDINPTWMGHAIGKWEGDTLVVDRVGFNDKTWLDTDGRPHTEMLHIVERYRRPDFGHLEYQTTVEDPEVLAKPWTMSRVSDLAPGSEEVLEFICNENNRDPEHLVGK